MTVPLLVAGTLLAGVGAGLALRGHLDARRRRDATDDAVELSLLNARRLDALDADVAELRALRRSTDRDLLPRATRLSDRRTR